MTATAMGHRTTDGKPIQEKRHPGTPPVIKVLAAVAAIAALTGACSIAVGSTDSAPRYTYGAHEPPRASNRR